MATPNGQPFTKLLNFRDVAASINSTTGRITLKPGLLYRSARPDEATQADRQLLLETYKIKTIIDLRTPTEHLEQAKKHAAVTPSAPAIASDRPLENVRMEGVKYVDVNLNGSSYSNALIKQLSYWNVLKLFTFYIIGWRKDAIAVLATNVMAKRGLDGLAVDSLIHSKAEIKAIFDVLCNPESYPVLVHCTQGKDRTGLTVLLVLMLLDVDREAIEKDYRLSERELLVQREEKLAEIRSIGLPDSFADCPADWTRTMYECIDGEEGGVERYLQVCGVTREQQEKLREMFKVSS